MTSDHSTFHLLLWVLSRTDRCGEGTIPGHLGWKQFKLGLAAGVTIDRVLKDLRKASRRLNLSTISTL